jgi:hypothetical protein
MKTNYSLMKKQVVIALMLFNLGFHKIRLYQVSFLMKLEPMVNVSLKTQPKAHMTDLDGKYFVSDFKTGNVVIVHHAIRFCLDGSVCDATLFHKRAWQN